MTIYQLIVQALLNNVAIEWDVLASHSPNWAQLTASVDKCLFYGVAISNQPRDVLAFNAYLAKGGN